MVPAHRQETTKATNNQQKKISNKQTPRRHKTTKPRSLQPQELPQTRKQHIVPKTFVGYVQTNILEEYVVQIKVCSQQKMNCHAVCQCVAQIDLTEVTTICENVVKTTGPLIHLIFHGDIDSIHTFISVISGESRLPPGYQGASSFVLNMVSHFEVGCHKASRSFFLNMASDIYLVATKQTL